MSSDTREPHRRVEICALARAISHSGPHWAVVLKYVAVIHMKFGFALHITTIGVGGDAHLHVLFFYRHGNEFADTHRNIKPNWTRICVFESTKMAVFQKWPDKLFSSCFQVVF